MNGILVVDKPQGITSHDVVSRLRRVLSERRIGHAGTLDPMATGVLVLGVGRATRLLRFLEAHDKTYEAELVLGVTTSTQDAEGEVLVTEDASGVSLGDLEAVLPSLRGEIDQMPPMVSAIKIGGEALYKKARRGEEIERPARRVKVHELRLVTFEAGPRPRARLLVRCSKGTYVRTIAADIGEALGVGAHLTALRRTAVGSFRVEDAVALDAVTPEAVRTMDEAVAGYPRVAVDTASAVALIQGKRLPKAGVEGPYAVFGPDGLVAMAADEGEEARSLCVVSGT